MTTLRDVAGMAGVSIATVSNVINNSKRVTTETRERVESAIARTGFVPNHAARTLARRGKSDAPFQVKASGHTRVEVPTHVPPARKNNALRALLAIRASQPVSRSELARRLDVHRSTITEIVAPLLAAGLLREECLVQDTAARSGRPPVGLSLRADGDYVVGVHLGVRRIRVGASALDGRPLGETAFETPAAPAAFLELVRSAIEHFRATLPGREVACVGVSVPGIPDAARSALLYAPHLGWRDLAVAGGLSPSLSGRGVSAEARAFQVIVENDVTAAAGYESRRRHRRGDAWEDFALVRVGTGIGVGLVLGGEVYRGTGVAGAVAGEFGHMTIVAGGKPCVCGNRGCWERYAAEPGLVTLYTGERQAAGAVRFAEVVARAKAGERRAQAAFARVGEYLGIGIGNVTTGLGLTRVVVGGRITDAWEFISGPLNEAVARSIAGRVAGLSVEPSEPAGAGLGGALEVAAEHYLTTLITQKRASV